MKLGNLLLGTAILLGIIFLSGLGMWQVQRLAWKQALIARVETNLSAAPLELQQVLAMQSSGQDIEYRPVRISGTFQHSLEQHYFATYKGSPGYFVYTPMTLADARVLFVNRGFVPLDRKATVGRAEGQITGIVAIDGLARTAPAQKPNRFVPENDLDKNIYHWKSLDQMNRQAFGSDGPAVVPIFVDAGPASNPGGLPIGGVTRITFPNSHLQYALTWFGLAGALLVVGGYFLFGRIRSNSAL